MAQVTLLDGSIGQELVKRSGDRATALWSTQVMIDHPKLVGEVHLDYFNVGATVATTNTYAVLRDRLVRIGLEDKVGQLTDTAVRAARRARAASGGKGRVAGAIGPLVQSYKPETCPPAAEAAKIYAEPVALMKDHVDLFLLETMSSVDQAEGALRAASGQGLPVWLALSVDDRDGTRLRSGEPVAELAETVARHAPAAALVNCSRPEATGAALDVIRISACPLAVTPTGSRRSATGSWAMRRRWMRWSNARTLARWNTRNTSWAGSRRGPPSSAAAARSARRISRRLRAAFRRRDTRSYEGGDEMSDGTLPPAWSRQAGASALKARNSGGWISR